MSKTRFDLMRSVLRERINEVAPYAGDDQVAGDWLDAMRAIDEALALAAQDFLALQQMLGANIGRGYVQGAYGSPLGEFKYHPTIQTLQAQFAVSDADLMRENSAVVADHARRELVQALVRELEKGGHIHFEQMPKDARLPYTNTWRARLRVEAKTK